MPTLVYNCPSGISGDMNLGAMIGLGVDPKTLKQELRKLPYAGWHLHFEADQRGGISGIRCSVHLASEEYARDHDNGNDHGNDDEGHDHNHDKDNDHDNGEGKDHDNDEGHRHGDGATHEHHHRTFSDIREAIQSSTLNERVKTDSIRCFHELAKAEGAVHGLPPEDVHFHEVGAIDSIVDMVGAAICWDLLNIDRIVCQNLEVGGGTVDCAHGRMPVPAPATARLLDGIAYSSGATNKETTTPTGAALLVGRECEFHATTAGTQQATAVGVGQRNDPNLPNVLYATLIDETATAGATSDQVWELAVNIDDMSAESIGFLCDQIRECGALECWQSPAYFKKGRPGTVIHTLCENATRAAIEACIFKHSTTLGIRRRRWERSKLLRTETTITTEDGPVRIKETKKPDGSVYHKFEYDDCARIARQSGRSLEDVRAILRALKH